MPWRRIIKTIAIIIFTPLALVVALIVVFIVLTIPRESTGVTWRSITIGESTAEQVIAELGPPDEVDSSRSLSGPFEGYYYFADEEETDLWRAIYRIGVLKEVVITIHDRSGIYQDDVHLSDFIELYGTPDHVTWGHYSLYSRVVIFLDDGILVEVEAGSLPEETDVEVAHYFRPCSMTCIRLMFPIGVFSGRQVPPEFPGMYEYPPWSDWEDPWGFTDGA